jgi:TRAP-type transport system periplasmic protein
MNRDVWNKLPKDVQKIMDEEAWAKLLDFGIKAFDDDYNQSAAALKSKGIEFITVSPDEMARWKNTVQEPVNGKWLKEMKEKGVDGQMILDKYAEAYKEFAAKR